MGLLAILKLLVFILWPAFLLLPYYFLDKEDFKKRFKEIVNPSK